jgi:DNA-binding transcriptional regulator YhcF (GntR family)
METRAMDAQKRATLQRALHEMAGHGLRVVRRGGGTVVREWGTGTREKGRHSSVSLL